jgi:hypothetical protein
MNFARDVVKRLMLVVAVPTDAGSTEVRSAPVTCA